MMKKFERVMIASGMLGVILYVSHTILGQMLWPMYDPITMDISSLTAEGAPHATLLRLMCDVYAWTMFAMVRTLMVQAKREKQNALFMGFSVLMGMQMASYFGYSLFPLEGDKTQMTFQNQMHIVVTIIVVFSTMLAIFLIAYGFHKSSHVKLRNISFVFAILVTLLGALNPIVMAQGLNVLGLTERLVIFTIMVYLFGLSYNFSVKEIR